MKARQWQKQFEKEQADFLKALLLDVDGGYLTDIFKQADERLNWIRENEDNSAGGLVVCTTKDHADKVAGKFEELFGQKPLVVHSDNPDATTDIKKFVKSNDRWIIAVRMVSEGVDIPRLRVGIYATNITKELTFRQIIGRVVRRQGEYDERNYND